MTKAVYRAFSGPVSLRAEALLENGLSIFLSQHETVPQSLKHVWLLPCSNKNKARLMLNHIWII